MMKRARDIRIGDKVNDAYNGTYVVSRFLCYPGLGVMTFDQDGQEAAFYPYNHEVEVLS